jgi:hypothetical protein
MTVAYRYIRNVIVYNIVHFYLHTNVFRGWAFKNVGIFFSSSIAKNQGLEPIGFLGSGFGFGCSINFLRVPVF